MSGSHVCKTLLLLRDNHAKILQCGAEVRLPATSFVHCSLTPARAPNCESANSKCPPTPGLRCCLFLSVSQWVDIRMHNEGMSFHGVAGTMIYPPCTVLTDLCACLTVSARVFHSSLLSRPLPAPCINLTLKNVLEVAACHGEALSPLRLRPPRTEEERQMKTKARHSFSCRHASGCLKLSLDLSARWCAVQLRGALISRWWCC